MCSLEDRSYILLMNSSIRVCVSTLTFKHHVKKVANKVKFILQNFQQIKPFLDTKAAKLFLHTIFFHILSIILQIGH